MLKNPSIDAFSTRSCIPRLLALLHRFLQLLRPPPEHLSNLRQGVFRDLLSFGTLRLHGLLELLKLRQDLAAAGDDVDEFGQRA